MRHDQPKRTSLGVDRSAVYGVRDENFRVRHARVQFGESEDYFVAVLGFRGYAGGHQFSAKLVSLRNAGSSQQLLEEYALVGFGFVLMGIHNAQSCAGHVFKVCAGRRERRGHRAGDLEFRNGGRSLGHRRLAEWKESQKGEDGWFENGRSLALTQHGCPRFADEMPAGLLLFDHDFRGFNDGRDSVAHFEVHFNRAAPGARRTQAGEVNMLILMATGSKERLPSSSSAE